MVLATALWGATFVVVRASLAGLDPAALVFARFTVSAAFFAPLLVLRRRSIGRATVAWGAVAGGLAATSAGSSAFLTCAGTLFAAFLAWPLLGQRPSRVLLGGIALALAGAALISLRAGLALGRGELWTLAGALAYALQVVVLGRVAPRADPVVLTGIQSLAMSAVLASQAGLASRQLAALGPLCWARFAYLALAGSALEPLFALAFALTVGAERFAARWWLGAGLILAAVVLVERRPSRAPEPAP